MPLHAPPEARYTMPMRCRADAATDMPMVCWRSLSHDQQLNDALHLKKNMGTISFHALLHSMLMYRPGAIIVTTPITQRRLTIFPLCGLFIMALCKADRITILQCCGLVIERLITGGSGVIAV